jgi:hypothetical protein
MKVYGFRGWDWDPDGFVAGLPANFSGMPSIEPTILERPGGFATFGPSSIREMTIPVEFIYQSHEPGNDLTYEEAYRYLFKRLQAFNDIPGELRGELNDTTLVRTRAVMRIYGFASFDEADFNTRRVDFVSVAGWENIVPTTVTGTF